MSKNGTYIGIGIAIVAIIAVFLFTNIFELAKPSIEQSVDSTKDAISQVQGKDVVKGAEDVYSNIQNETSKIEVKNPLP